MSGFLSDVSARRGASFMPGADDDDERMVAKWSCDCVRKKIVL